MNSGDQVGSALGLAVHDGARRRTGAHQLGNASALTDGYGGAGIAVAGGLVAAVTLRRPRQAPMAETSSVEESERGLIAA